MWRSRAQPIFGFLGALNFRASVCAAFSWWASEFNAMLPSFLKKWLIDDLIQYSVHIEETKLVFRKCGRTPVSFEVDAKSEPDALPLPLKEDLNRGAGVTLYLPKSWALRRLVTLPMAAANDLQEATSFMVGRVSPFQSDQAIHSARLLDRDRKQKLIRSEMSIVPRNLLQPVLLDLKRFGIPLLAMRLEDDTAMAPIVFKVDTSGLTRLQPLLGQSWKYVVAATIVLVVFGPFLTSVRIGSRAERLEAAVLAEKPRAIQAMSMRANIDAKLAANSFLPGLRAEAQPIEILNALSAALPDDAWLFRLEISKSEISMGGFASDLAAVLKKLSAPPFASPELTTPVVSDVVRGKSRFELHVGFKANTQ